MERNVQQLEISRRVDDERARLEKERRKALDAQRAAAIAAAKAKKQTDQLPPVIPDYTANGKTPDASPPADAPPAPTATPAAKSQPDASQASEQPPVEQQPAPKPAENGNSVLTPKITVEPLPPPPGETTQGDATSSNAAIDPDTGLPIGPKAEAAARPASERPVKRPTQRSSSDE